MTVATQRTDTQIKTDVLRELGWDPRVDETEVGVQVKHGIVTLTGQVSSYAKRLAAASAAHRVKGVLDVANDLEVRLPGGGVRSDTELAEAVRRALHWSVLVPDEKIQSTVSNGWVTLAGSVDRIAQRRDAERAVENLSGVKGVTNSIDVKIERPATSPDRIQSLIEGALERRALREADRIHVSVDDAVVTLEGVVHSWGERHAIEQAAGFAPGVQSVNTRLTVDPYV